MNQLALIDYFDLGRLPAVPGAFLAIDHGNKTGVARIKAGRLISASFDFTPERHNHPGERWKRFSDFLNRLDDVDAVFYEKIVFVRTPAQAQTYGGYNALRSMWCANRSIPEYGFTSNQWKKLVVGKGNAKKRDVLRALKAMGFKPKDDNEADAIGVLLFGLTFVGTL